MGKKNYGNDPGFGFGYKSGAKRAINKDGTFNAKRINRGYSVRNTYQTLVNVSWPYFLCMVVVALVALNALFAGLYMVLGVETIKGVYKAGPLHNFLQAFYFSFQTFTTVGYGHLAPITPLSSLVASLEAMIGLMCFALVTGLIYGRFSRPTARLLYSSHALIAPYKNGLSLQFRIANKRMSMLLEMHATVVLLSVAQVNGKPKRSYTPLSLERDRITFFPLNWTIVHPITEASPLYGKNKPELARMQAEVLILIRGFDDTFGQTVHARHSYLHDEIVWGAKFKPAFHTDDAGNAVLDMSKMDEFEYLSG